ncbi:hypothetical protein D5018_19145 [Parashewanella curva]|uniref:Uncharacterized protein n=1 Tax=Parashewanella curva TaxID=2338552 RepID=A0A3L8PRQ8_9GAMM|nr:hypothetical protein [Parashewanella curva]RLV58090.1 hypothetical protein D5018_19145 [Parashewanella curva]
MFSAFCTVPREDAGYANDPWRKHPPTSLHYNKDDFVSVDLDGFVGIELISTPTDPRVQTHWKQIEHFFESSNDKKTARDLYFQLASVEIEDRKKPKLFEELKTLSSQEYRSKFKQDLKVEQFGESMRYSICGLGFSIRKFSVDPKNLEAQLQEDINNRIGNKAQKNSEKQIAKPSQYDSDRDRYELTTHTIGTKVTQEVTEVQDFFYNETDALEATLTQALHGTVCSILTIEWCPEYLFECPGRCRMNYEYKRLIPGDSTSTLIVEVESYKDFCFHSHQEKKNFLGLGSEDRSFKSLQVLVTLHFNKDQIVVEEAVVNCGENLMPEQITHILPQEHS